MQVSESLPPRPGGWKHRMRRNWHLLSHVGESSRVSATCAVSVAAAIGVLAGFSARL